MLRTSVAVLGTLAEFHREPIPYDLQTLVQLVSDLHPDLLCLDITPEQWQRQDFQDLPPEYREALLPLANQTDMVIVPIGGKQPYEEPTATGWKGAVIRWLRKWLAYLQRTSPGPADINQGLRHHIADLLYTTIAFFAGTTAQQQHKAHTKHLIQQVLEVAHRDPGRRILVAVNVRYCHLIRPALKKYSEIQVVNYTDL
jgi:hypothetical protein